jgi:hypothetical protein
MTYCEVKLILICLKCLHNNCSRKTEIGVRVLLITYFFIIIFVCNTKSIYFLLNTNIKAVIRYSLVAWFDKFNVK